MKILVYVPLEPGQPRIHSATWQSIQDLRWHGPLDMLLARNDQPIETHHYADLRNKHNRMRDLVLRSDYDAVLLIEADMLVPPDTLERLAAVPADVAYGLYCTRHHNRTWADGYRWLAFYHAGKETSLSWSQYKRSTILRNAWGKVVETDGLALGCTLIHRHVLRRISFRCHPDHTVADDWLFALDCKAHGFKQMHDFGCICGHILKGTERAVWPDIDAENFYSIREIATGA